MTNSMLTLYILGHTPIANRAIKNLEAMCDKAELKSTYNIKIIDLYDHPELAEQEKILATPLLIIKNSASQMRIIGDLSNGDKVFEILYAGMMSDENII